MSRRDASKLFCKSVKGRYKWSVGDRKRSVGRNSERRSNGGVSERERDEERQQHDVKENCKLSERV